MRCSFGARWAARLPLYHWSLSVCVYGDQKLAAAFLPHSLVRCGVYIAREGILFVSLLMLLLCCGGGRPAGVSSARRTLTRGEL